MLAQIIVIFSAELLFPEVRVAPMASALEAIVRAIPPVFYSFLIYLLAQACLHVGWEMHYNVDTRLGSMLQTYLCHFLHQKKVA